MTTECRLKLLCSGQQLKLREIIDIMEEAYCGTVGVEFTHIADLDQVLRTRARTQTCTRTRALARAHTSQT